jgi:CBS-domain-containing membrane protein
VDAQGRIVGVLSDLDCLRAFRSDQFDWDDRNVNACVADFMSREVVTIEARLDLYGIADAFLHHPVHRLVVVEGEHPVGLVTRRDLMRGIQTMRRELAEHPRYPDYPHERIPLQSHYRAHWSRELPAHSSLHRHRGR